MLRSFGRRSTVAMVALSLAATSIPAAAGLAQSSPTAGTPTAYDPCPSVANDAGMGAMAVREMPAMGSPAAGMPSGTTEVGTPTDLEVPAGMEVEFDQIYIDMMIPHHASIVAMAEAARPRLADERLRTIAQAVIETQRPEIEELRGLREQFYGSPEPVPMAEMDEQTMGAMVQMMPGMGSMDAMMFQMDAAAQVAALCGAEDADRAFIDLTIPHHEMAIVASESALTQAVNPEIRDFARRVIDAQRVELETLTAIREELPGSATPESVPAARGHDGGHAAAIGDEAAIRAIPADLVAQIERGEGAGLALPAEANGVPGPRHALDLADELGLSDEQRSRLQETFDAMKGAALPAGEKYLAAQRALEADFRAGTIGLAELPRRVADVSRLEGELATVHLAAHLEAGTILTPEQTAAYVRLRGE